MSAAILSDSQQLSQTDLCC